MPQSYHVSKGYGFRWAGHVTRPFFCQILGASHIHQGIACAILISVRSEDAVTRKHFRLGFTAAMLSTLACSNIEDRIPATDKLSISVPAAYYFWYQYPPVDSPPVIHLQTYDWYPNTCYWLSTSAVRDPRGRLLIYVGDAVSEGGSCGAAFIQAEAIIPLDTAIGSQVLVVVRGDSSDHYEVIVHPDRTQLITKSSTFTVPTDSVWWRVPRKSVAMTCEYSDTANASLCEEIIDSVFDQSWITQVEIPTFGVWPYPPNAGVYIYRSNADFDRIKRLLDSYPIVPQGILGGVHVDLLNWRQERYSVRIASE